MDREIASLNEFEITAARNHWVRRADIHTKNENQILQQVRICLIYIRIIS